jgi:hypothetical protein
MRPSLEFVKRQSYLVSPMNHLRRGELVYDPFLGSGTTLAAAELTERVCYGIELDPKYVDVVIQRWQQLTGKQATLDGNGRAGAPGRIGRNRALPPGDRGPRNADSLGPFGSARAMPGLVGLVGGVELHRDKFLLSLQRVAKAWHPKFTTWNPYRCLDIRFTTRRFPYTAC